MPFGGPGGQRSSNQTINQVFHQKGLWQWFNSGITNYYDGVTEKGLDYSTTFGTPVGVPVGGRIMRIVHNNNSIGDVVELQDAQGGVWLYQHITATVRRGQVLGVGDVIGNENGLPRDQYSTGPHIEVRYAGPGTWNPNTDSWLEPWINPQRLFGSIGNQLSGTVGTGTGNGNGNGGPGPGPGGGTSGGPTFGQTVVTTLAPNADLQVILMLLDELLVVVNPFVVQNPVQDTVPLLGTFTDPIMYIQDVAYQIALDFKSSVLRVLFFLLGLYILYKVANNFINFGAIAKTGMEAAGAVAAGVALAA